MKLLRASVRNSQKIDKSFEKIFNVLFYFAIACVILNVLGYDPIAVFLSLSSVVLAFSFMISQASSKYIEGLLFILYRRPYDIGVSSTIIVTSMQNPFVLHVILKPLPISLGHGCDPARGPTYKLEWFDTMGCSGCRFVYNNCGIFIY